MPTKPAELAIPADLAKAYEVKDLSSAETKPAVAEAPVEAGRKKRSKRGRKGKNAVAAKAGEGSPLIGPGGSSFTIPSRHPNPDPLTVGERIWMDVSWLGTRAGEFLLEVLPYKLMSGRKVYDLRATARTSDFFSIVYKVEDWVESFVDFEGWFPYKFVLHGDESKHIRDNLELFDHGEKKQYVHSLDNRIKNNEIHEEKGYKELTPLSQDSLSALYYVRTQKLAPGEVVRFPMTTGGNQWETEVSVLGREEVSTKIGMLPAFKTKIETRFKGVLQQQGDAFIWFADNEWKYPLRFEAKVKIGWVTGVAKKIEPGAPPQTKAVPAAAPRAVPAQGARDASAENMSSGPEVNCSRSFGLEFESRGQLSGGKTENRTQTPNRNRDCIGRPNEPLPPALATRGQSAAPAENKYRTWFRHLMQTIGSAVDKKKDPTPTR